jgi:translation initiation factor IF-1
MGKNEATVKGMVTELLPNVQCRVQLDTGSEVRAYLSGKMKLNRIKVLVGDTVELVMDKYGPNNRIVRRVDKKP